MKTFIKPLVVLLFTTLTACTSGPTLTATVGSSLPPIGLQDGQGHRATVEAVRTGRPALLTFWASWCQACHEEFAALNRLEEAAQGQHALVIGIAVGESPAVASEFAAKHGLRYVQLMDEEFALADALGQRELPATVVLSRSGQIVFSGRALDEAALKAFRAEMALQP